MGCQYASPISTNVIIPDLWVYFFSPLQPPVAPASPLAAGVQTPPETAGGAAGFVVISTQRRCGGREQSARGGGTYGERDAREDEGGSERKGWE